MKNISATRIGAIMLSLLFFIGIVTAVGIGSSGFKNWQVRTWFDAWGKNKNGETVAVSSTGAKINAGGEYLMPEAITVMPLAVVPETGDFVPSGEITLMAVLSNSFIKGAFDFSAEFKKTGDWETGKKVSDYLQITKSGDDSVKLQVLAPFGAPIELKAVLQGSGKTAVCRIDYLKRFTSNMSMVGIKGSTISAMIGDFGGDITVTLYPNFAEGTIEIKDVILNEFRLTLDDGFKNSVKKYLNFDIDFKDYTVSGECTYVSESSFRFSPIQLQYSDFITDFNLYSEQQKNAIYYAWYKGYQECNLFNVWVSASICHSYTGIQLNDNCELKSTIIFGLTGASKGSSIQADVQFDTNIIF